MANELADAPVGRGTARQQHGDASAGRHPDLQTATSGFDDRTQEAADRNDAHDPYDYGIEVVVRVVSALRVAGAAVGG